MNFNGEGRGYIVYSEHLMSPLRQERFDKFQIFPINMEPPFTNVLFIRQLVIYMILSSPRAFCFLSLLTISERLLHHVIILPDLTSKASHTENSKMWQ